MFRPFRVFAAMWQAIALLLAAPALAAPNHIAASLLAEHTAAPGETVTLALLMQPERGWHGYWSNPGDAGFGTRFDWALPAGAKLGEVQYPVPKRLVVAGLMNYVYDSEYALLVPFTVPDGAKPGTSLPVSLKAEWLACTDEICVPEAGELNLAVEVAAAGSHAAPDPRFERWRMALPAPLGGKVSFALTPSTIRLGVPLPASVPLERPYFFAANDGIVAYGKPQTFHRKGDLLLIDVPRAGRGTEGPNEVSGILKLNPTSDGLAFVATPGQVPQGGDPIGEPSSRLPSLPILLLMAVLGGLLLNVMPCVFPILSLKALSLARAGESEQQARREGLAYTAGVVVACLALGAILLAVRAGGEQVGWAFQLQEPLAVAGLLLLAVAITANLLGLFEFAVPGFASEGSPQGAFATGLLAAFAATPCTGPFMATAMGAALFLPTGPALLLFVALGLGIALPFLAIAYVPSLRAKLPRPGAWMIRFRRWMALPMGLTALALLWLSARVGGTNFAILSALFALAALALLFEIGRYQRNGKSAALLVEIGTPVLLLAAAVVLPFAKSVPEAEHGQVLAARAFSASELAAARASGKPVFVWFTADWCLTCKVNEGLAIETEATRKAFERAGVVMLRGDWTRRDPEITRFLASQGAAGVPLYLWYPAGGGEPQQLPQVLTPGTLPALVSKTGSN